MDINTPSANVEFNNSSVNDIKSQNNSVPLNVGLIIFGMLLQTVIVGAAAYYIGFNRGQVIYQNNPQLTQAAYDENQKVKVDNSPNPTAPTATHDSKSDWQSIIVDEFNLQFKLPPSLSKYGKLTESIMAGESGTAYCLTFPRKTTGLIKQVNAGSAGCSIVQFGLGTTSTDFVAGRSGGFTDFQGYEVRDGKYYGKFPGGVTFEIPPDIVKEYKNSNGITMIKVLGKNYEEGPSPFVYRDSIGALINITNKTYPGISILMDLNDGLTEEDFDQILSTFKHLD